MSSCAFLVTMDRYTRIFRFLMRTVGCLPSPEGTYNMVHVMTILVLMLYNIVSITYGLIEAMPDDYNQISYLATPFIALILVITKLITYIWRRKDNSEMIKFVEQFWIEHVEIPAREREVIEQYGRYLYLFIIAESICIFSATPMWYLLPVVDMLIFQRQSDQPFHWILPMEHTLPFHIDPHSHPLYEFLYAFQVFTITLGAFVLTGMDSLFLFYVLNTSAQFKILQMRIQEFDIAQDGSTLSPKEQEKKIATCIEFHQKLLTFCQKLEELLNIPMFVNFFVGIGFLCTAGFIITMFPGNAFLYVQSVLCISSSVSELFLLCFTANQLTTQGLEVADAAYSSNWFNAPNHIKKEIMFMIMRTQRPIYITVGGFTPVSVSTFESILRTAASYFTVLTSMSDEN